MRDFRLDIYDLDSKRLESLPVSHRDVDRIREQASDEPVSPLLASWIENLLDQAGYRLDGKAQLMEAARLILGQDARTLQLRARRKTAAQRPPEREAAPPVSVLRCKDPAQEARRLARELAAQGHVPVFWNMRAGLRFELDYAAPETGGQDTPVLTDLADLLSFILRAPNRRLAYILEDYQEALDAADAAGRAKTNRLLEEVRTALADRDEKVVALVREAPPAPVFAPSAELSPGPEVAPGGSLLARHAVNLTDPRRLAQAKPVIAMEAYIRRAAQILIQMETNNPLLVGHPGVGKTAVAEGLARLMAQDDCPPRLKGRSLYSLSLASLIAGTRYRGDLEDRVDALLREVTANKDRVIVFIDEIHTLMNAGASEGGLGLSETLKPALARGDFPCMGATTREGAALLAEDPALARRFKLIAVSEPDRDTAVAIVTGVAACFERHHGLSIAPGALAAAVDLSISGLADAFLPGKAVSLLDGAAAYCAMCGSGHVTEEDIAEELRRIISFRM
ncbi:Chaperone protein ClpB [Fundidesulfovibrio magnetotacticus]|uniref:Chaperone protein ClpB n=1 Tax=Fundidesulfovibrio magnetotacticus TaxID=2730080 RepID=A0A6V8LP55_9BACT|nr:AAA family ATPase [Fundidesulfovibrio magnetotacticus]GFK92281.1 Chaperone protein ClpB [Fundidesulfovibrio magnetotacticus]